MELKNFTVSLPQGTTNHSDQHLLCTPATWESIALFFIGNYFSHAATVKTLPASPVLASIWIFVGALLMPASGLVFGLVAFYQALKGLKQSELRKATLARALCMYVRTSDYYKSKESLLVEAKVEELPLANPTLNSLLLLKSYSVAQWGTSQVWSLPVVVLVHILLRLGVASRELFHMMEDGGTEGEPADVTEDLPGIQMQDIINTSSNSPSEENIETAVIYTPEVVDLVSRSSDVHSQGYSIPDCYTLAYVPMDAIVDPIHSPSHAEHWEDLFKMSKSRNTVKSLVAFLQFCFSIYTLVRSRGNQITLYGFSAFSLTVAPYAVMAAVNLLANACMPQYNFLFLVKNDVMMEIESDLGLQFQGVVGEVRQTSRDNTTNLQLGGNDDEMASQQQGTEARPQQQDLTMQPEHQGAGTQPKHQGAGAQLEHQGTEAQPRAQDLTIQQGHQGPEVQSQRQGTEISSQNQYRESRRWVSGFPDRPHGARMRLLTPGEALSAGILPRKYVTIYPLRKVHKNGSWCDYGIVVIFILGMLLLAAPIAIVAGLSHFQSGTSSTETQQIVLMVWLGAGQLMGLISAFGLLLAPETTPNPLSFFFPQSASFGGPSEDLFRSLELNDRVYSTRPVVMLRSILKLYWNSMFWPWKLLSLIISPTTTKNVFITMAILVYGSPAILGFVIVGEMLSSYGNCIRVY